MKKFLLFFSLLISTNWIFAQCDAPSGLTAKQGDIVFSPVSGISVYEIYVDGSVIPVSAPTSVDRSGNYHYQYSGSAANWYSLPVKKGSTVKARAFCISEYWYDSKLYISNWSVYHNDASKFSSWSSQIVIK